MPGSNWHVYVYDPDGHTNELYYGIEQIGWNQLSKPTEMYYRGFREKPSLPQMSEIAEVAEALDKGIDVFSGNRTRETAAARPTTSRACCCRGRSRSPRSARWACSSTTSTAPRPSTSGTSAS